MLGPEVGLVYNALYNKCVLLHVKWRQYLELFGTKPERLDLLNRSDVKTQFRQEENSYDPKPAGAYIGFGASV